MAIVSTGQLTIVDNNDARPLTAYISANPGTQQIYTKDESTVVFNPNWTTVNSNVGLQLQARVFAGGAGTPEEVTGQLSNKKWSFSAGGTAIVTGAAPSADYEAGGTLTVTNDATQAMLTIKANLKVGNAPEQVFFEGDYTDPITGLVSRIVATITLSQVKTGTNAVYINLRAPDGNILEPNASKTQVRVYADLIRAAGVDDTGTAYRWYQTPHAAADQIDGTLPSVTTKYGALTTAQVNASAAGVIGQFNSAAISTSNMPDAAFVDAKGLVIHHTAVTDIQVFKVEVRDSDNTVYQQYFTVYDVSDPYEIQLISTAGEKLQNGVGNTDVYPTVYYGSTRQTNTSGFTFNWYFYDRNGQRGAFVDATRTALAGGRQITANTTTTFTYSGTAITFAAGDIIKTNVAGVAKYYEVASATGNTVTIRAPTTNTWLGNNSTTLVANAAVNGYMFVCLGTRSTVGTSGPDSDSKISLSGDDIDAKGVIMVEANK
jgi:hypothetical protein